jgi:hypothetical protein
MPAASMVAELTEIDSLPGTEIQPAPGYRYVNARSRDNTLGMSGHIIRSFQSVLVIRLILRYEPVINIFHISTY